MILTDREHFDSSREDVLLVDGHIEQTLVEKLADLDAGSMTDKAEMQSVQSGLAGTRSSKCTHPTSTLSESMKCALILST